VTAPVAAYVAGRPVLVAEVEARLAALRCGPYAARLPHPATAEGRNLRRWLVQVLTTEAVLDHEARSRGLAAQGGTPPPATLGAALRMGGVTAAVLAVHPLAAAVRAEVTAAVTVPEDEVRSYWERNRDRHPGPFAPAEVAPVLLEAAQERAFGRWLDERCAALVRLEPGFEHPGNPVQPDYAHHH
jgi:[acyl-carrier-protein] S-malonyltransferase